MKERDNRLDYIKTLAILGVITIHTCSFDWPLASQEWLVNLIFRSFVAGAVPLFIMCTGVLFFDPTKEKPLGQLYGKNILRIIMAMIFWAMTYKIYHILKEDTLSLASLWNGFKEVLLFKQEFHLYYLAIALLLYVFSPMVRVFTKNASPEVMRYFILIWFALGIAYPLLINFWPFKELEGMPLQWRINMAYSSIGYGVFAYYLLGNPIKKRIAGLLIGVGILSVFLGTLYFSHRIGALNPIFLEGMSPGPFFLATGVFGLLLHVDKTRKSIFVTFVSKASFCIYLSHILIMYLLDIQNCFIGLPVVLALPLRVTLVFGLSSLVYMILNKVPLINRWII